MSNLSKNFLSISAWGITKNSEFAGLLNHWLQKIDETGVKEGLWKRWTFIGGEDFGVEEATSLGFENITFPFLFVVAGSVGASIFLVFELCIARRNPRPIRTSRQCKLCGR